MNFYVMTINEQLQAFSVKIIFILGHQHHELVLSCAVSRYNLFAEAWGRELELDVIKGLEGGLLNSARG